MNSARNYAQVVSACWDTVGQVEEEYADTETWLCWSTQRFTDDYRMAAVVYEHVHLKQDDAIDTGAAT